MWIHILQNNTMANKENQPPISTVPLPPGLSPTNKPALQRQRDHSACRGPETPLKVRKTRENLKQQTIYADIPPPCVHAGSHEDHQLGSMSSSSALTIGYNNTLAAQNGLDPQTLRNHAGPKFEVLQTTASLPPSRMQRQKSVSRRMLTRVKQGIASKSKASPSIRPIESETSLIRRLSGRRRKSYDTNRRSQSFDMASGSIESGIEETPESISLSTSSVQRSCTDSTVSTADILGESPKRLTPESSGRTVATPDLVRAQSSSPPPSSPSPQLTPRPPPKQQPPQAPHQDGSKISLAVPCIDLYVALDSNAVDFYAKGDVWVAIEATVRSMTTKLSSCDQSSATQHNEDSLAEPTRSMQAFDLPEYIYKPASRVEWPCGRISTLRLGFKPIGGCRVHEIIGQTSLKTLTLGQQCSLFIKVHIPKIRVRDSTINPDQDSLFTELESIVGTLKMEILHVEARYRHIMLPSDNVVTIRHICKVKRPRIESRWSTVGIETNRESPSDVHVLLAQYLASHYPAADALNLLTRYLHPQNLEQTAIRQIRSSLSNKMRQGVENRDEDSNPSVVVTDIDVAPIATSVRQEEQFSTAPSTPVSEQGNSKPLKARLLEEQRALTSVSEVTCNSLAPPLITAPKTTTAIKTDTPAASADIRVESHGSTESQDSARQLWRHIRHTSLSAKQLEEMTPERLQHLEASDDTLRELRRKALANKRSVGAETLKDWKWEESQQHEDRQAEAPWM